MSKSSVASRPSNLLMLWADVALKTQEMLLSSGSVIQIRTGRMAKAALSPTPDDLAELQLMGHEKLEAASASGAAMARQIQSTQDRFVHGAIHQWMVGTTALLSMAFASTPAQVATHGGAFADAAAQSAATLEQLSGAGARVMQDGIAPLHAKVTSNARRLLARPQA